MSEFIGRQRELGSLQTLFSSGKSSISVVFGRRRIGKTSLIREACKGMDVLYLEGIENQGKQTQISSFLFQLKIQAGLEEFSVKREEKPSSWSEALYLLVDLLKDKENPVLVLDEFQWLANYRSSLVAELKMLWDQYFSKIPNFQLVLCGSIASFMLTKVVRSKALYGRIDLIINLKQLSLKESAEHLPRCGEEELLLAYLLVGGVPKYLELLRSEDSSIMQKISAGSFLEEGYFRNEFDKIFVSHFGSKKVYQEIIRLLNRRVFGLSRDEILQSTSSSGGGQLTKELFDLESAGFISSFVPFDKKINSKLKRYRIADIFLSFYLEFIEPAKNESYPDPNHFLNSIVHSSKFKSWLGYAFELMCFSHHREIAKLLGFSGVQYRVGPYFRHAKHGVLKGCQLDLVFERADKITIVCELKHSERKIPLDVGRVLSEKLLEIPQFEKKTIQRVLVTNSDMSMDLKQSGKFSSVVKSSKLLQVER